jgi:hypothetical protein
MKGMTVENYYEEFHKCIDKLIEINKARRKEFSDLEQNAGTYAYISEICTVHVDIGRRSGKTAYINSRATDNDLVICPRSSFLTLYKIKNQIVANTDIFEDAILTVKYDIIYIDEPALHKDITKYYKHGTANSTFVLLGK